MHLNKEYKKGSSRDDSEKCTDALYREEKLAELMKGW